MATILRGQVVWAQIEGIDSRKPYLIVSNNHRNMHLDDVLAVRITTTRKPEGLNTVVELAHGDRPNAGRVLCDDIFPVYKSEIRGEAGGLTPVTMQKVDDGLRAALGL